MANNQHTDTKLFTGLLIGAVGLGALTIYLVVRKEKSPLSTIGETIIHIGEILEKQHVHEPAALKNVEKKIHSHEHSMTEIVEWIAAGINLWKQLKK